MFSEVSCDNEEQSNDTENSDWSNDTENLPSQK